MKYRIEVRYRHLDWHWKSFVNNKFCNFGWNILIPETSFIASNPFLRGNWLTAPQRKKSSISGKLKAFQTNWDCFLTGRFPVRFVLKVFLPHTIHVLNIFTYIWLIFMANLGPFPWILWVLPKNWGSQTAVTMTCIFRISAFSWEVDATKESWIKGKRWVPLKEYPNHVYHHVPNIYGLYRAIWRNIQETKHNHRLDVWNPRDPITSHWKPDATAQQLHRTLLKTLGSTDIAMAGISPSSNPNKTWWNRTSDDEQGVYNHLFRKVFRFHYHSQFRWARIPRVWNPCKYWDFNYLTSTS